MGRMVMRVKTYDPNCYDLACDFLEGGEEVLDSEHYKVLLAREIQQAIETFLESAASEYEPSTSIGRMLVRAA